MATKRTNFKAMDYDAFLSHLNSHNVTYDTLVTTTALGLSVIKITPVKSRIVKRIFDKSTGKQLDSNIELTQIDIGAKQLLKQLVNVVDQKINNMSTKGVYHPRRLLPKWQNLNTDKQKLDLFTKYMKAPTSSIGFLRLVDVNLCNRTLESILIDHPQFETIEGLDGLRQKCIDKFKLYENGRTFLKSKQLL